MYMHVVAVYCDKKYETHTYKPRELQHRVNDEFIFFLEDFTIS